MTTIEAVPVPPPSWGEAYAIFSVWIRQEHRGARQRQGISFRAADDMQDLWHWIRFAEASDA